MSYVLEKVSIDSFYGINLINILKILARNPRISNTFMERNEPCLPGEIVIWETSNDVKMPEELKLFYLSNNGFKLSWSYRFGQEVLPVGLVHVSSLRELILLSGYSTHEIAKVELVGQKYFLNLGSDSKVFHLSHVDNDSRVCLVYVTPSEKPTIWLWDEDKNWHFLADNFMNYFRMSLVHIGLPYWQFCFTSEGVPAWVEQIILMDYRHFSNRRPYDIQQRKEMLTESKKHRKSPNVISKDLFRSRTPHNVTFDDMMKYHRRSFEKNLRR